MHLNFSVHLKVWLSFDMSFFDKKIDELYHISVNNYKTAFQYWDNSNFEKALSLIELNFENSRIEGEGYLLTRTELTQEYALKALAQYGLNDKDGVIKTLSELAEYKKEYPQFSNFNKVVAKYFETGVFDSSLLSDIGDLPESLSQFFEFFKWGFELTIAEKIKIEREAREAELKRIEEEAQQKASEEKEEDTGELTEDAAVAGVAQEVLGGFGDLSGDLAANLASLSEE